MLGGRRSLTTGPDRLVWCFSNELGLLLYTYQHSQTGKQASRQAVANRRSDQTKPNQPHIETDTQTTSHSVHARTTTAERQCYSVFVTPQKKKDNIINEKMIENEKETKTRCFFLIDFWGKTFRL